MVSKEFFRKYWIILFLIIIITFLFGFILYTGYPIGQECGWSFGGYKKTCECIGIKTGGCPPNAICEGLSYRCIGICQNCTCKRMNPDIRGWEEVPCD